MKIIYSLIFLTLTLILILLMISYHQTKIKLKKNKLFYSINEIDNKLNLIDNIKNKILEETKQVYNNKIYWHDWLEKELYNESEPNGWTIYPFFAFGIVKENCKKCPIITKFIKSIPRLKLATLSKLKGGTKLNEHEGWASHSNYVIRCHYGLIIPKNLCYIYVRDNKTNKEEKNFIKNLNG